MIAFLLVLSALVIPSLPEGAPERQPSIAGTGKQVYIAFGSGHKLWIARSTDAGQSFATPVLIADVGPLALGRHRGPRITVVGKSVLVSAITGDQMDLRVWKSSDGGQTWSDPVVVNDQPGSSREGLHALAAGTGNTVAAVWLDDREHVKMLYGSWSVDGGVHWSKNLRLYASPDGTICQCCHPSLVAADHGEFGVMFRNLVNGDRDLYAALWKPGQSFSTPHKQGEGSWHIDACPMDGGSLAWMNGHAVSAWRREKQLYLAQAGQPEQLVATGKDVSMAASGNALELAWVSEQGAIVAQKWGDQPRVLDPAGSFPVVASVRPGRFICAWEHDGRIHVTTSLQ